MIRRARWAIATVFFVNGLVIASWVPHIPAIKGRHALGDGELGLVLLAMAAGSVLSLPAAGWLVGRLGSRAMTTTAGVALCLAPSPADSRAEAWPCSRFPWPCWAPRTECATFR